ncbi:hypothetical protein BJV74DRAFT_799719 [Russula compacta]|nr:hypothetical protein BJV74DRAFT_799719 [Russula compacta]
MSHTPTPIASSSNYQYIFDNAVEAYKKKTKKDLRSHPCFPNSNPAILPMPANSRVRPIQWYRQRLTTWLKPTINVIYTFSATIGGGIGLVYPPAGVIFTGIGVLLSPGRLINVFDRIENFFKRLETYIEVPLTTGMTDVIVKIMVEVLSILGITVKEIKQSRARRTDMEDALVRLDQLTQDEVRMAVVQGLKATQAVDDKIEVVIDSGDRIREEIQQVADDVDDQRRSSSHSLSLTVNFQSLPQEIRSAVTSPTGSPPDPSVNYNTASDAHHEGTALWFTQSNAFKNWKQSGSFLWIHGKPGSGKSVLSSSIIQDIKDISNGESAHIAYFFFDFKDTGKQDLRALLSSLLIQLSHQSNSFCDVLLRYHSAHQSGSQQPNDRTLTQCLEDILKVQGQTPIYLIIDALDECPNTGMPSHRDKVLVLVEKLVQLKLPNLHLCVTSRPEVDIRRSLEPLTSNRISLHDETGQKEDILEFVRSVVNSDKNMRRWRDDDKETVIETLSERADGMFRWVFCQLETLRYCLPPSVRRILAELPETLDETYERILSEIPKSNQVHAHRLLQCLTVAVRPLHVSELAEVLAVDFGGTGGIPKLKEDLRWEDQEQAVLTACSTLIAVIDDEDSRVVQFSHFSVKEFLTSDRLATSKVDGSRYHHILLSLRIRSWRKLVSESYSV